MLIRSDAQEFMKVVEVLSNTNKSRRGVEVQKEPDTIGAGLLSCAVRESQSTQIVSRDLDHVIRTYS